MHVLPLSSKIYDFISRIIFFILFHLSSNHELGLWFNFHSNRWEVLNVKMVLKVFFDYFNEIN